MSFSGLWIDDEDQATSSLLARLDAGTLNIKENPFLPVRMFFAGRDRIVFFGMVVYQVFFDGSENPEHFDPVDLEEGYRFERIRVPREHRYRIKEGRLLLQPVLSGKRDWQWLPFRHEPENRFSLNLAGAFHRMLPTTIDALEAKQDSHAPHIRRWIEQSDKAGRPVDPCHRIASGLIDSPDDAPPYDASNIDFDDDALFLDRPPDAFFDD